MVSGLLVYCLVSEYWSFWYFALGHWVCSRFGLVRFFLGVELWIVLLIIGFWLLRLF